MGVPALLLALAPNQRGVARKLGEIGAAVDVGDAESFSAERLASRLREMLDATDLRSAVSHTARSMSDGLGADRVRAVMQGCELNLRPAKAADSQLLFAWANDPEARSSSFHPAPIEWRDHERWYASRLSDPNAVFYIGEVSDGRAVGLVRFQLRGDRAVLSINIDSRARGQGWGRELVYFSTRQVFRRNNVEAIDAFVKPENRASVALFGSSGFRCVGQTEIERQNAFHFALEAEGTAA
jgi:RimJ/RimL family protein N-acetyltransferase